MLRQKETLWTISSLYHQENEIAKRYHLSQIDIGNDKTTSAAFPIKGKEVRGKGMKKELKLLCTCATPCKEHEHCVPQTATKTEREKDQEMSRG